MLGYRVRYDGRSKSGRVLCKALLSEAELFGICPEMECGLGIPREPIGLEGNPERPRLLTLTSRRNLTAAINRTSARLINELRKAKICGFIFKSRSPTCGLNDAPVHGSNTVAAGLFARAITKAFPGMPVADEVALTSRNARKDFLEKVRQYRQTQAEDIV